MQGTMTTPVTTSGSRIVDLVESLGSIYIAKEQLDRGVPLGLTGYGNNPSEYPHVKTGEDADGSTLQPARQLVAGVDNRALLAGAGLLLLGLGALFAFGD